MWIYTILLILLIKKEIMKKKEVRLWICQTNVAGNINGHFHLVELDVDSKRKDVVKELKKFYSKVFNITNLGIFKSLIGDKDYPTKSLLKKFKTV